MIWLIELALVLFLVGFGLRLWGRRGKSADRETLTMRRVDAYIETIRRERRNADLVAMSDHELRDLLDAGARNYRVAGERRLWILFGIAAATVLGVVVALINEGFWVAAAGAAVGGCALYGLNVYLERQARQPLERHGIDIDRLIVE
jgi:Flp pilus assembly protein TadB